MSTDTPDEPLGHLDDADLAEVSSSDPDGGPAAAGEDEPAEGSPGAAHPTGQDFPDESVRYGDDTRPRSEPT